LGGEQLLVLILSDAEFLQSPKPALASIESNLGPVVRASLHAISLIRLSLELDIMIAPGVSIVTLILSPLLPSSGVVFSLP
jgi:hypothetical protein